MCELPKTERSPLLRIHATITTTSTNPPTDVEIRSSNANDQRKKKKKKKSLSVIVFGQVVALALACGNASSSVLENQYQIHTPTCLTGLVYFVLSFHIVWLWRQRTKQETKMYNLPFTSLQLYTPWYIYLLLSILDVEANYLTMLSFQQTKLSSSMLLTSLSVLSTVLWRKFIFGSNISGKARLFGVFLCIVGGCLCLQEDVHHNQIDTNGDLSQDSRINGDLLALVAAFLYGLNDVLAEYFVKNNDRIEYLAMLGLFGTIFSFCVQAPILEGGAVRDVVIKFSQRRSDMESDFIWVLFLLFCFVAMLSFFYVAVSLFLSKNDATILNLSLQSCPLWAVVLATVGEIFAPGEVHWFPPPMFFVALILVVAGTFSYESEEERNEGLDDYSVEDCDDADCCEVAKTSSCGSNRYRIDEFIP